MYKRQDLDTIKQSGVRPIGLSYDKVEVLEKFASGAGIQFPLLADPDSKILRQLGIANTKAREGTKKYNIAYPMTIVIGSDSTVAGVIPGTTRERHNAQQLVDTWSSMSEKTETAKTETAAPASALEFKVKDIEGETVGLDQYKGKVVVMVNVASKCGLTPQYASLQQLHKDHKDDGLVILGFPCNQFGNQEPGSEADIKTFCSEKFGVEFDMFSKLEVNGEGADPLYKFLTAQETKPKGTGAIKWNFEKFVVGRDGKLAGRFGPRVAPDSDEFKEFLATQLKVEAK